MYSSPIPCFLVPLRPKYPPQHPILENPQPTLLHQCERPSFTPIWKTAWTLLQIKVQQHVFLRLIPKLTAVWHNVLWSEIIFQELHYKLTE
jgi:hypothetical protein